MGRPTFLLPGKLLVSCALILIILLCFLLFKKSDLDAGCEVLRTIAHPGDLVVISDGLARCSPPPAASQLLLVDSFRLTYYANSCVLSLKKGGRAWSIESRNPEGRVIVLSRGATPAKIIGRCVRAPLGDLQLTVVHPMESPEGRWDLLGYFSEASVWREGKEGRKPCPLKGDLFDCGAEEWMDVKVTSLPFGGTVQSCIFAHPVTGSMLTLEFTAPAETRSLVLSGGIDDMGVGYPSGTPVTVSLAGASKALGSAVFDNSPGFFMKKVCLSEAVPAGQPLALRITTPNQDTRHFCFRAVGMK